MSVKTKFEIVHLDDDILVANKSSGILCVPGRDPGTTSLLDLLRREFGTVFTVHRIDRDTSGLVIFARNADTHRLLSLQFEERQVTKTYQALVSGKPAQEQLRIDAPLLLSPSGKVQVHANGKASTTQINLLESFKGFSRIEARPVSGRQHQIRVHLKYAGIPLIVDPIYHTSRPLTIHDIKLHARVAKHETVRPLLDRTPLHAYAIRLEHPDGQIREYVAPLPKDMRATLNQLRKWRG